MIQRRKFERVVYDFLDEYKTIEEATRATKSSTKSRKEFGWKGWSTHFKITKSTHPNDKKPFKLWGHNDPKIVWKQQQKKGVLKQIDPELRSLIRDLNANGIFTIESCSGHNKDLGKLWLLKSTFSITKFQRIMRKHGMQNVRRRSQPEDANRDSLFFTFELSGQKMYKKGLIYAK